MKIPAARMRMAARITRPTRTSRRLGDMLELLLAFLAAGEEVAQPRVVALLGLRPAAEEAELAVDQQGDAVAHPAGQGDVVGDDDRGDAGLFADRVDQLADRRRGDRIEAGG